MPNRVEWNVANLGIAKAGAVTVTCNSRYKAFEVEYVLKQSDAKALILMDRFDAAGIDYTGILREICPEIDRPGDRPRGAQLASASLPLTGSGKVQKFKQKAYAVEKYGLKEPG
jgi:hypothetical protein